MQKTPTNKHCHIRRASPFSKLCQSAERTTMNTIYKNNVRSFFVRALLSTGIMVATFLPSTLIASPQQNVHGATVGEYFNDIRGTSYKTNRKVRSIVNSIVRAAGGEKRWRKQRTISQTVRVDFFDIYGQGKADPRSMIEAIKLAYNFSSSLKTL